MIYASSTPLIKLPTSPLATPQNGRAAPRSVAECNGRRPAATAFVLREGPTLTGVDRKMINTPPLWRKSASKLGFISIDDPAPWIEKLHESDDIRDDSDKLS